MEILNNFTVAMFPPSFIKWWAVSLLLTACNLHIEATLTLKDILEIIQWCRYKPQYMQEDALFYAFSVWSW